MLNDVMLVVLCIEKKKRRILKKTYAAQASSEESPHDENATRENLQIICAEQMFTGDQMTRNIDGFMLMQWARINEFFLIPKNFHSALKQPNNYECL